MSQLLNIFIILQPILDLITGIQLHYFSSSITIGIAIRMLFLLFIIVSTILIYHKKSCIIYYLLIAIYIGLYIIGIYSYQEGVGMWKELASLMKVFYFPILLLSLYQIKENIILRKKILQITFMLYTLLIFIPMILNIGYESYEITKKGTLGFFNSANEISGIFSILTPIMFLSFLDRKYLKNILATIIYLIVILNIGTKTPLLALIITIAFGFIWLYIQNIKMKKYKPIIISTCCLLIVTIMLIFLIPRTNFYKNIQTHLKFLKVESVEEVLTSEELIDHFIFSQRLTFLKNKSTQYKKASWYQKLIGIGYLQEGKETKMVEMDYFDIFYSHGIIGSLLVFSCYSWILIKVMKQKRKFTYTTYMLEVSLLLILLLSLLTGHIIISPSVSILVIIIILLLEYEKEEGKEC